jgi:hypothetical protein
VVLQLIEYPDYGLAEFYARVGETSKKSGKFFGSVSNFLRNGSSGL